MVSTYLSSLCVFLYYTRGEDVRAGIGVKLFITNHLCRPALILSCSKAPDVEDSMISSFKHHQSLESFGCTVNKPSNRAEAQDRKLPP